MRIFLVKCSFRCKRHYDSNRLRSSVFPFISFRLLVVVFFFFSSSHAICNAFFPFWITSRKDMNMVAYEYELCAQAKQLALRQLKHIYCYPLRFAPLQMFEKYSLNSGHICSSMIYRRSLYYVKIKIWEKHTLTQCDEQQQHKKWIYLCQVK